MMPQSSISNKALTPKLDDLAIRKAQAEFDAAQKPLDKPKPTGRKLIGNGSCPRCGVAGEIYAVDKGGVRHLEYANCQCAAKRR